ncbi:sodium-dependent transporter [Novosphingobium marinum]|uniref:NSS family neurotransmitter:Na+ symporter n=1 Tax=Novosphingobium marinum TaxID=1514948 RepID=A0A7Y9XTD3_9SPHN|nr:sodium-dependent transporter [Novosphingobium marinum]NYH94107.1 NSS family neurotransmitter:Na+ symporter [Novosphingobium marinum]GGC19650.1 sodium-dependent transporter [Novosphingobium marinum]
MVAATQGGEQGWSSRTAFVLAAIGAAVGLGNIWRFPTLAGENGGGAFVFVYVVCVILIGLPMVLVEIMLGRAGGGHANAIGSVADVAEQSKVSRKWSIFGGCEVLAAFLILSFYSVVAGWVLNFVFISGADFFGSLFSGAPLAGAHVGEPQEAVTGLMGELFASPWRMLLLHALFMATTLGIVAVGVHDGIEKAASWLMPSFFVLLVLITIYGAFTGDFARALAFLFTPDFSRLSPTAINEALGQAFFSLSLGSAALITYGSYVGSDVKLAPTAGMIAAADTGVAILAGLMIFPIVFTAGLDPSAGPALIFQSLPIAFQTMPAGALIGFAFFLLIFFAALTSSISLLEGPVAWTIDTFGIARRPAAVIVALASFVVGVACILGYGAWSDVRLLGFWAIFAETDILDTIDGFTGKVMLPLAGLGLSIFAGWRADRRLIEAQTGLTGGAFLLWRGLVAWLAPFAVFLILIFGLFPWLLG